MFRSQNCGWDCRGHSLVNEGETLAVACKCHTRCSQHPELAVAKPSVANTACIGERTTAAPLTKMLVGCPLLASWCAVVSLRALRARQRVVFRWQYLHTLSWEVGEPWFLFELPWFLFTALKIGFGGGVSIVIDNPLGTGWVSLSWTVLWCACFSGDAAAVKLKQSNWNGNTVSTEIFKGQKFTLRSSNQVWKIVRCQHFPVVWFCHVFWEFFGPSLHPATRPAGWSDFGSPKALPGCLAAFPEETPTSPLDSWNSSWVGTVCVWLCMYVLIITRIILYIYNYIQSMYIYIPPKLRMGGKEEFTNEGRLGNQAIVAPLVTPWHPQLHPVSKIVSKLSGAKPHCLSREVGVSAGLALCTMHSEAWLAHPPWHTAIKSQLPWFLHVFTKKYWLISLSSCSWFKGP